MLGFFFLLASLLFNCCAELQANYVCQLLPQKLADSARVLLQKCKPATNQVNHLPLSGEDFYNKAINDSAHLYNKNSEVLSQTLLNSKRLTRQFKGILLKGQQKGVQICLQFNPKKLITSHVLFT